MDIQNDMLLYLIGLIALLPLLSSLIQFIVKEKLKYAASLTGCALLFLATILSVVVLYSSWQQPFYYNIEWFQIGDKNIHFNLLIDFEAAVLLIIVTFISFLVHLFSLEYMKDDEGYSRYFGVLGLFTFSMVGVILTDHLMIIFMFWELVGLCSYLLIGHWYKKDSASQASKKAFIVNRIGDIGFVVAIALCWYNFETLSLSAISQQLDIANYNVNILTGVGLMLFIGAIGKSAQFPLQVWLPDAMEGPTPVSALIHAATMVAAGVYLLARVSFLLTPDALLVVAIVGSVTALMGAVGALYQMDIKKVLAFSTISQLGYMVMAIGLDVKSAALFHLYTHAFFKAGLFLAAGSIIHSLHHAVKDGRIDVQDMNNMGGLRKAMPVTSIAFVICGLSLIGVPLFSGFLSKDAILIGALNTAIDSSGIYWFVAVLAFASVMLTAFYVVRQFILVFFGNYRGNGEVQESPLLIKAVLIVLAIFSLGFVWAINPFSISSAWVVNQLTPISVSSSISLIALSVSLVLIALGATIAYQKYRTYNVDSDQILIEKLSVNNWYLDQIYELIVVKPFFRINKFLKLIERSIIDRFIDLFAISGVLISHIVGWVDRALVDGLVYMSVEVVGKTGKMTRSIQGGSIQSYIIWAVLGLLIILILAI